MQLGKVSLIALSALAIAGYGRLTRAELTCPPPPQQVAKDVVVETEGQVNALGRVLGSGELKNKTAVLANNLWAKYPNADRIALAQLMMSVYCQTLRDSKGLSDIEKLEQLQIFNKQVIELAKPADTSGGVIEALPRLNVKVVKEDRPPHPYFLYLVNEGGDVVNLEYEHFNRAAIVVYRCADRARWDSRHYYTDMFRFKPGGYSSYEPDARRGKVLGVGITSQDAVRWVTELNGRIAQRGKCVGQAEYSDYLKVQYEDVLGSAHRQFFQISQQIVSRATPSARGGLAFSQSDVRVRNINEKRWESEKTQQRYSGPYVDWDANKYDDQKMQAVANKIFAGS